MDRPEEHLIRAARQPGSPDGPAASENPFRLPSNQPPVVGGAVIGAGLFLIIGMALAETSSEELMVFCALLGGILGGSIGILCWVASWFRTDDGKNPFRLSPKKPNDLPVVTGIAIGAGLFLLLGMALAVYLLLREVLSLHELIMPLVAITVLGGFLGGSIGLLSLVTSWFRK